MKHLLGNVSRNLSILETNRKTVICEERILGDVTASAARIFQCQWSTDIVIKSTAAIYVLIGIYRMKRLISKGTYRIRDNKPTKFGTFRIRNRVRCHGKMDRDANGIVFGIGGKNVRPREPVNEGHPYRKAHMFLIFYARRRQIQVESRRRAPMFCGKEYLWTDGRNRRP